MSNSSGPTMTSDQIKSRIQLATDIMCLPREQRHEIYKLYDIIAKAALMVKPEDGVENARCKNLISDNPELFQILANPMFYYLVMAADTNRGAYFSDPDILTLPQMNKQVNYVKHMFKDLTTFNSVCAICGGVSESFDVNTIPSLIQLYNTPKAEYTSEDEILDEITEDDLNGIEFDDIDTDENEDNENDEDSISDKDLEEILDEEDKLDEKHKEEFKNSKISGTAKEISESEKEENEELAGLVELTMNNIIETYAKIFSPLYRDIPKGVLYTNSSGKYSIMTVGNSDNGTGVKVHELSKIRLFTSPIYQAILETGGNGVIREAPKVGDDGMHIDTSWMNSDGTMKYNYAPHIQVRNCMGVYRNNDGLLKRAKTWDEFKEKFKTDLKPTVLALLKRVNTDDDASLMRATASIQELYTTILLVNEFDQTKNFRLTILSDSLNKSGNTDKIVGNIIARNPLQKATDTYKVMNSSINNGILSILVVTNIDQYRGEINFGYKTIGKVVQTGGTIDISHAIVGTDLTGNPVEVNLNNNAYTSIGIIAGSRSGKGVLTLSLLASMLAANCPVVYLDYKPDMAGAFWKLERDVPGSKILAIDGQTNKLGGLTPVRNYRAGYGSDKEAQEELSSEYNVIPYIKGIQIMNLIGKARVMGSIPKKKKMFFILDEAQKCGDNIADSTKRIEEVMKKFKPKGKDPESDTYKYLKRLHALYSSTATAATEFLNTNAGSGNMSAIVLGQQADAGNWRGPFSNLVLKCPIKFLGNGTKGGSKYGLDAKTKGADMLGTGYFGLSLSNTPTPDTTTMIKTTMVLNDADFDANTKQAGEYTGALLKNITNDAVKNEVINNDMIVSSKNEIALSAGFPIGSANPLVGFPGLIKYIGSMQGDFDLANALSSGYLEVERVLNMLGIVGPNAPYHNVEAYMYSGKLDSLFTSNQLGNALNNNMTIYDYMESGVPEDDGTVDGEENPGEIVNAGARDMGSSDNTTNSPVQTPINNNEEPTATPGSTQDAINRAKAAAAAAKANMPNINLLSATEAGKLLASDGSLVNKLGTRILKEFAQQSPNFNLSDRSGGQYSLQHLCWNISIWVAVLGEGFDRINTINPNIATFTRKYIALLNQNRIPPDYIPKADIVLKLAGLNVDESAQNSPNPVQQAQATQAAEQAAQAFANADIDDEDNTDVDLSEEQDEDYSYVDSDAQEQAQTQAQQIENNKQVYTNNNDHPRQFENVNGKRIVNTQQPQGQIISLNDFNYAQLASPYNSSFLERMLCRTEKGRSEIFNNGIRAIVGAIDKKIPDRNAVTSIIAHEGNLVVNGIYVDLSPMFENNEYGLRFQDVVNVRVLLGTYKRVEELALDATMFEQVIEDYGDTAQELWVLFQANQRLRKLKIQDVPGQPEKVFTRQQFREQAAELQTSAKKRKFKMQTETVANVNNPRLSEEGIGVVDGSLRLAKGLGSQFEKRLTADNPKLFSGIGFGLLAGGAIAIHGVTRGIRNVFRLARSRSGR